MASGDQNMLKYEHYRLHAGVENHDTHGSHILYRNGADFLAFVVGCGAYDLLGFWFGRGGVWSRSSG